MFLTIGTHSYDVYTVQPGTFVRSGTNVSAFIEPDSWALNFPYYDDVILGAGKTSKKTTWKNTTLTYQNREECIDLFAQAFVTDRRFVILELDERADLPDTPYHNLHADAMAPISSSSSGSNCTSGPDPWICAEQSRATCESQCDGDCHYDARSWTCSTSNAEYCSSECDISRLKEQDSWTPFADSWNVSGCYSQKEEEYCKVEMASQLAAMVLVVTLLHFVFLFLSLYHLSIAPLLSLGDAISSFLQRPDSSTRTIPFSHLLDALQNHHRPWNHGPAPPPPSPPPRHRKLSATTPSRRLAFAFLLTAILGLTTAGLALGITRVQRRDPSRNPFATGIGASVNIDTLMPIASSTTVGPSATIWRATLLANAGQPLLSLLHCAYNALFTALYLGAEWDGYGGGGAGAAGGKKGLRISSVPRGAQRASHFLQLPWRYGVPLSAASTLLHWLASQSVFTVSLVDGGDAGEAGAGDGGGSEGGTMRGDQLDRFFGCGFSPLAMALLLVALLALLACLLAAALPRFKTGMPVVGSCSAAIAAACRPHPRREEAVAVSSASPSCKGLPDSATDCPEEDISALPLSWGVVEEGVADRGGGGGEVRFCALTSDDEASVEPWMRSVSFAAWRERALGAMGERDLVGEGNEGGR